MPDGDISFQQALDHHAIAVEIRGQRFERVIEVTADAVRPNDLRRCADFFIHALKLVRGLSFQHHERHDANARHDLRDIEIGRKPLQHAGLPQAHGSLVARARRQADGVGQVGVFDMASVSERFDDLEIERVEVSVSGVQRFVSLLVGRVAAARLRWKKLPFVRLCSDRILSLMRGAIQRPILASPAKIHRSSALGSTILREDGVATAEKTPAAPVVGAAGRKREDWAAIPDRDLFMSPPPRLDESEAEALLAMHYGLSAEISPLHSERDANFLVVADDAKYILKISNDAEPGARTVFNSAVLAHLATHAPDLPVPKLVPTVDGEHQTSVRCGGSSHNIARLLTYLDGVPLSAVAEERHPLSGIGARLGRLDKALEGFQHPDMEFSLVWDSARVDRLADLIRCIPTPSQRLLIERQFDRFATVLKPKLAGLRRQVIHNDANLNNVLVSPRNPDVICGLFDFGDSVVAPAVNELAVACSYHIRGRRDPSAVLTALASGYHRCFPLREEDIEVLPGLVIARFMTTILVTHWRATLFPENRAYILRNNPAAWSGLRLLSECDAGHLADRVRSACGMVA